MSVYENESDNYDVLQSHKGSSLPRADLVPPTAMLDSSSLIQMSILLVTITTDLTGVSNVNITTSRRCFHSL